MKPTNQPPELPGLDPGIQLLEADGRARYAVHALVLDHALGEQGNVYWIDAIELASAHPLIKLAPSERVLKTVDVARAQTSVQHYSLIEHGLEHLQDDTALLVTSGFDRFYRDHDRGNEDGQDLMLHGLAHVANAGRTHDLPVLMTRYSCDEFSEPLVNAAEDVITYEETRMGPRFAGEDFETLVYPRRGGFQTTLAYWQRILQARYPDKVDSTATSPGIEPGLRH